MLKDGKDKLAKDGENKEAAKTFRLYSPQLDRVIEAESKGDWEKKVQELLHANQQE